MTACIFAETSAPVAFALQCLDVCFDIKKGSIMVHMDGFNQNEVCSAAIASCTFAADYARVFSGFFVAALSKHELQTGCFSC